MTEKKTPVGIVTNVHPQGRYSYVIHSLSEQHPGPVVDSRKKTVGAKTYASHANAVRAARKCIKEAMVWEEVL